MKKVITVLIGMFIGIAVFGAGVDFELFGYKVFNVGVDANPFSRDDGRYGYVPASAVHTATVIPTRTISPNVRANQEDRAIVVKDSQNVTIVNSERQQRQQYQPVYAPSYSYPTYTYPTYYSTPVYYYRPTYYYRPYYRPCYRPCYYW